MVRHIVWWTLKNEAGGRTADENAWHIQQASAMLHGMPSLMTIEVSAKVEASTTVPAKVVLSTTHKNMADLETYRNDPVHLQFAAMVNELATSRNAIDYALDEDPKLA